MLKAIWIRNLLHPNLILDGTAARVDYPEHPAIAPRLHFWIESHALARVEGDRLPRSGHKGLGLTSV